jgi:radical SAM protein with 4Fe4S-binding SPASM domain
MNRMYRKLKAPMNLQFEITSVCNEKCLHCYNYWRDDNDPANNFQMPKELFDLCMDEIIKNEVLHVIFTGGEPLTNFDVLLHGVKRATAAGLSVSCNSNLLIATREKLRLLKEAGLPHILTSLNSHNPETNDKIVSHRGAFETISHNIRLAVQTGIKISTNMIITRHNIHDIYETGKLSHELGAQKFHITRVITPTYIKAQNKGDFTIEQEALMVILDQLSRVKSDFPIGVKTLIPIPLCALKDLDAYSNIIGRPCAAGKRAMSIDCNGHAHACWHMVESFGDITKIGLKQAWDQMQKWRSGELIPDDCQSCPVLPLCGAGCRLSMQAFGGNLSSPDLLRLGHQNIIRPYSGRVGVDDMDTDFENILTQYEASLTPELYRSIEKDTYVVAKGIRIRDENGFGVVSIVAGTSFFLEDRYTTLLKQLQKTESFTLDDVGQEHKKVLAYLATKNVIQKA